MKIYSSYFAMAKKFPKEITQISIALNSPNGFAGKEYKPLAPSYSILSEYKETHDKNLYVNRYCNEILFKLDPNKVLNDLHQLAGENDIVVLLCYERSGDFCHRTIVANWLINQGIEYFGEISIID